MKIKRKIIIDLDVVTVGFWDKGSNGDLARKFLIRVKQKEFDMITPLYLLEHLIKWKYITLKEQIENFYVKNSKKLLTNEDVDAFIVLVASMFNLYYLITFNRKHLRNKRKEINEVLSKNGLKTINIVGPEEV